MWAHLAEPLVQGEPVLGGGLGGGQTAMAGGMAVSNLQAVHHAAASCGPGVEAVALGGCEAEPGE